MEIGKKYKIESDSLNITLFKRGVSKKDKKESWRVIGYFSSVKNALKALADLKIKESELKDLKSIIKKQEEIYRLIEGLNIKEV